MTAILWMGCLASAVFTLAAKPQSDPLFEEPVATAISPATTSPRTTAEEINARFQTEGVASREKIDDYTFLRRVSLDLTGKAPTPGQIDAFARNGSKNRRSQIVEKLLESPDFGKNWGRYWRDVILARRSDDRALGIVAKGLATAIGNRLNHDVSWGQIARSFITASGDLQKKGETGLFLAQKGETAEITSEITRLFMGMQIQCAQCHDHPSEDWTREQFHQMAAFFPRLGVRKVPNAMTRNFEVYSADGKQAARKKGKKKQKKKLEHFMPDLENPKAQGTLMQPVFFQTGQSLEIGATDMQRRKALADWMTDPETNPWFARAYVNRIWSELIGKGFYEPVDDLGDKREGNYTAIFNFLSDRFAAGGFDTKWLFQTIMATDIYQQRGGSPQEITAESTVTACPQPLRGDPLFSALSAALEINNPPRNKALAGKGPKREQARNLFNQAFFYDPSLPRDEINATIPQALLMMNGPQLNQFIRSDRRGSMLRKLLAQNADNNVLVEQLYLRCLSREPDDQEQAICLAHIKQTGDRTEAYEDILWALINSAEFRYRR